VPTLLLRSLAGTKGIGKKMDGQRFFPGSEQAGVPSSLWLFLAGGGFSRPAGTRGDLGLAGIFGPVVLGLPQARETFTNRLMALAPLGRVWGLLGCAPARSPIQEFPSRGAIREGSWFRSSPSQAFDGADLFEDEVIRASG
jgi:hypothetical protein